MQLYTKTITVALAMRAASVVAASPDTCKMLTDADSPFITSVARMNGIDSPELLAQIPIADILAPVDDNFPWLSKCVANVDVSEILAAMMSSHAVGVCFRDLEAASELIFPNHVEFSDGYFSDNFCPPLTDIAIPCLNDVFLPELAKALAKTGSCCSDLNDVIVENFGANIPRLTATLSKLLANAICSTKTTIVTGAESSTPGAHSETCGYSLLTNFVGQAQGDWELLMRLAAAVQIPEEEVCKAIEGEKFDTTTGHTAQFETVPGGEPYGICYNTAQNLVSYVKAFPFLRSLTFEVDDSNAHDSTPSTQYLSDIFSWGTCVRGDNFLRWIISDEGIMMKAINVFDALQSGMSVSVREEYTEVDSSSEEQVKLSGSTSAFIDAEAGDKEPSVIVSYDQYSSTEYIQALLSQYVAPLKSICIHFPSAKACDYDSEKLKFTYGDVGRTVKASSTPIKKNADEKGTNKM